MRSMSRNILIGMIALAMVLSFSLVEQVEAQETWGIALEEIEGSVQDAWAQEFKKRIEEETDGEVEVVIYPYGQLGTGMGDLAESAQMGNVEFTMTSPSVVSGLVPEARLFSLHYIWPDSLELTADVLAESDAIHEHLAGAFEEKDLHLLSLFPEGWQVWTANDEIRTPEDMEDLKIRVMPDSILSAQYRNYGADPTQMDYSEVYSGLQLGSIDAQVNPVFAIEEMAFYEQQEYLIWGGTVPYVGGVSAGLDFWNSLDPEMQELVSEVATDLNEYIYEMQDEYNTERLDIIRENDSDIKVVELSEDERAEFKELAEPVWDEYVDDVGDVGQTMLDIILEDIENAKEDHDL
ncbi:MAG: TRAP transporter substrate-binding protein DctP [Bacillota bacterium]